MPSRPPPLTILLFSLFGRCTKDKQPRMETTREPPLLEDRGEKKSKEDQSSTLAERGFAFDHINDAFCVDIFLRLLQQYITSSARMLQ